MYDVINYPQYDIDFRAEVGIEPLYDHRSPPPPPKADEDVASISPPKADEDDVSISPPKADEDDASISPPKDDEDDASIPDVQSVGTLSSDQVNSNIGFHSLPPPKADEDDASISDVQSIGTSSSDQVNSNMGFHSLPNENLLYILLQLNDPYDIVAVTAVNRMLYSFIHRNSTSLMRQEVNTLEMRGGMRNSIGKKTINLSFAGTCYGSKRLWKGLRFKGATSISDLHIEMFSSKVTFREDCVVRLDNIRITKHCLPSFADFMEKAVRWDFPEYRRELPFQLEMNDCSFLSASRQDITTFFNKMVELGCFALSINSVAFEDFDKLCAALSKCRLQRLALFRFHSVEVAPARTDAVKALFKPFFEADRITRKLVIDGFEIPLDICEWAMIKFCSAHFFTELPPPGLRIVLSIDRSCERLELNELLKGVKIGVNEIRAQSKFRHRLNHVYLELGKSDMEMILFQNQYCIIDIKVRRATRTHHKANHNNAVMA